jgi:stalled ribosome rescue protein Dom34
LTKNIEAAASHAVVWLDHHHADVWQLDASPATSQHLKAHSHPTSQHGSEVRAVHEYFAEVCNALDGSDAVLVTGSKTSLADFRHYAEKHRPQTAKRIAAYDVVDHPTENQLTSLGRKFFEL